MRSEASGKCSPAGRSMRLGGNTSVFFRIVFSRIFQCPSVPPMIVLRSKGGTSMVFFRKCYTTAIAKKALKKIVFYHKIEDFGVFWGVWAPSGAGSESGGPKHGKG